MNEKIVRESLKNCIKNDYTYCKECRYEPFDEKISGGCMLKMIEDTCELFTKKDLEIADLNKENLDKERAYTNEYCLRREYQTELKALDIENERLNKEINQLKEVIKAKEILINTLNKCYAKSVADACDKMVELLSEKAEVDEHNDWWIELPVVHKVAYIVKELYKNETNNN